MTIRKGDARRAELNGRGVSAHTRRGRTRRPATSRRRSDMLSPRPPCREETNSRCPWLVRPPQPFAVSRDRHPSRWRRLGIVVAPHRRHRIGSAVEGTIGKEHGVEDRASR